LNNYPRALLINQKNDFDENINKTIDFIREVSSIDISYDSLLKKFNYDTIESVGKRILKTIK